MTLKYLMHFKSILTIKVTRVLRFALCLVQISDIGRARPRRHAEGELSSWVDEQHNSRYLWCPQK
jgi:hypothetical protein